MFGNGCRRGRVRRFPDEPMPPGSTVHAPPWNSHAVADLFDLLGLGAKQLVAAREALSGGQLVDLEHAEADVQNARLLGSGLFKLAHFQQTSALAFAKALG
jgi:hypothetical protein